MDIGQFIDDSEFKIESLIGQGAYGRVYLARDVKLNRLVAVKELHQAGEIGSTLFNDYARRFEREAGVQAGFNHPNITHVYRLLTPSPERMYLVMEYVDGGSLKDLLQQKGTLPLEQALHLMGDILAGLAAVHADPRDIVHRDIKPSNILLTRKGQAKLTDFGLAQVSDESLRSAGGQPHPGTPLYMSPEQATTTDYLYPSSDVFSTGCVFFEMLSGMGYKQAVRRKQTLVGLRPEIPAWVSELVMRMLAKDPAERPCEGQEAAELLLQGERERLEREKREREERERREKAAREAQEKAERERLEHENRERKERESRNAKPGSRQSEKQAREPSGKRKKGLSAKPGRRWSKRPEKKRRGRQSRKLLVRHKKKPQEKQPRKPALKQKSKNAKN
ncbi:MAG: protein kinase [Anaerolineales bacterium]|nr:protein kinase [Anaerolineales bacterium]